MKDFSQAGVLYLEALEERSNATERAARAEAIMQKVRALGRLPVETRSAQEQQLARDLRHARAAGLMAKHEEELQDQAAKGAAITAERMATERAAATAALLEETHRAVARGASAAEEHALLQRGRALTSTLPVQQSLAMQAELEEVRWLLARNRQARQHEQKKKRSKLKHRRLAARR